MKVVIARTESYTPSAVAAGLDEVLAGLGGMSAFIRPGDRVLIKPNMLEGLPPAKAVTTHPEVVRGVIRAVRAAGGVVMVGDSPGIGGTVRVADRCGILAVCREEGVELVAFDAAVELAVPEGGTVKRLEVAAPLTRTDKVISVAKMKTHSFMTVTGAVKNLFGFIVGPHKAQFHLRMKRRDYFAGMLVDLARLVSPVLYIVDGVVGMEGNGPRNGQPKEVGVLMGGANGFAVDLVMARVMGLPAEKLPVAARALALGLTPPLADIEVLGSGAAVQTIFAPPKNLESLEGRLPGWLVGFCQYHLTARPAIGDACIGCRRCAEHCPPAAITMKDGRAAIDLGRCIRCYCCQELCPAGAVGLTDGLLLKAAKRVLK